MQLNFTNRPAIHFYAAALCRWYDLQSELVDHLANSIEANGNNFQTNI
jgi:hypothetical protein